MPDWTGRVTPRVVQAWWQSGSLFAEFESTCIIRYPDIAEDVWLAFDYLGYDMQYFAEYIGAYSHGFMQTRTSGGDHYSEHCVGYGLDLV